MVKDRTEMEILVGHATSSTAVSDGQSSKITIENGMPNFLSVKANTPRAD